MSQTETGLYEGLVVSDQSGFFSVEVEGVGTVTCRLRGRLMEAAQSSDIAAIGDRVAWDAWRVLARALAEVCQSC